MNIPGPLGTTHTIAVRRYGRHGARPQAYIQAGLRLAGFTGGWLAEAAEGR